MIAEAMVIAALFGGGGCTEDMACWNWATMGNHRRGVTTRDLGERLTVTPCQFKALTRRRVLRYEPMLGDRTALKRRCTC